MQKAWGRETRLRRATCRGHRLAGKAADLRDRPDHARIEFARGQGVTEAHAVELARRDVVGMRALAQLAIGGANARGEQFALLAEEATRQRIERSLRHAFRLDGD